MCFGTSGFHKAGYFLSEQGSTSQWFEAEEGEVMEIVFTCNHVIVEALISTTVLKLVLFYSYNYYYSVARSGYLLHRLKSRVPVIPQRSLPCSPFTTTLAV